MDQCRGWFYWQPVACLLSADGLKYLMHLYIPTAWIYLVADVVIHIDIINNAFSCLACFLLKFNESTPAKKLLTIDIYTLFKYRQTLQKNTPPTSVIITRNIYLYTFHSQAIIIIQA